MNNSILIKIKGTLFKNFFLGHIIINLFYFSWHYLGMPVYYICYFLKKPYIGGYYCTDTERFKRRYIMLRKSLKYLIDSFDQKNDHESINILEIGTCAGGSTLQFCNFFKKNNIENYKIFCVDHWKSFPHHQGKKWSFREYNFNKGLDSGKIFKIFKDNIKFSGFENKIEVVIESSEKAFKKLRNYKFDFVYIDGSHKYSIVHSDIKESISLLKETSYISGDDYEISFAECDREKIQKNILDEDLDFCLDPKTKKTYHPGVIMAVNDFFGNIPSYNGFWVQKKINKKFENIILPT